MATLIGLAGLNCTVFFLLVQSFGLSTTQSIYATAFLLIMLATGYIFTMAISYSLFKTVFYCTAEELGKEKAIETLNRLSKEFDASALPADRFLEALGRKKP